MKKLLGISSAVIILALGALIFIGIKSALEKAERERAEREAFNAAADAEEKLNAYCSEMRKETREIKRRAAKIEELIEENRTDAKVKAFHAKFEQRLELLDSVSAHSMSTKESVDHDYYRELFVLDGMLRELLIVKESKDRIPGTDDEGINEAFEKAADDLTEIGAKMHDAYDRERDLLLSKIVKTVGLSESMQSNAVERVKTIITATCEGALAEHWQSIESATNAIPAQTLQVALHRNCTNSMAALDAIDTGKMRPNDASSHKQYRKSLVQKDELQENYLNTRINALLNRAEGESPAKALDKARNKLDKMQWQLNQLQRWFGDLKNRERKMLLLNAAESLGLTGADVDDFVSTVTDLIGALGTAPL